MTKEISVEFDETLISSKNLNAKSVQKSSIILIMYSLIWGSGLFAIFYWMWKYRLQRKKISEESKIQQIKITSKVLTPEEVSRIVNQYLEEIFPSVYQHFSYFTRMLDEIIKHHIYVSLIAYQPDFGLDDEWKKVLPISHVLTIQTMLMFLLSVFYQIEVSSTLFIFIILVVYYYYYSQLLFSIIINMVTFLLVSF